jgi:SAM-dependent methyltransferase
VSSNVNSLAFWNDRFASGLWESVGGRSQTTHFAFAQTARIPLEKAFSGRILDFGCGLADAIPVYRERWPKAELFGADFSDAAIAAARRRYGHDATFVVADHRSCPEADVIIASNVLEHLDDDIEVVGSLLAKCHDLFVTVPYDEQHRIDEHVRSYDRQSFSRFDVRSVQVFPCRGWSQYGWRARWWQIHAKNIMRPFFKKTTLKRRRQVLFHIRPVGETGRRERAAREMSTQMRERI